MPVARIQFPLWLGDKGSLPNAEGWLEVLDLLPAGAEQWMTDSQLEKRLTLADGSDVLGYHWNAQNGVNGELLYIGTSTKIRTVEPSTWAQASVTTVFPQRVVTAWQYDDSGASYVDITSGLQGVGTESPFPAGAGVDDIAYFGFLAPPISPLTFAVDTLALPTTGQDETNYVASFSGGSGHAVSDVITLSDGSTITVDAVDAGVVTEFTVDASGSTGFAPGSTLTQTGTTGSGIDFSLTPGPANYNNGTYTVTWEYWNGSAWTTLPGVVDGTTKLRLDGELSFTSLNGLTTRTTVNSSASLHWIRAKRDGGTVPTDPVVDDVYDDSEPDANIGWQFAGYGAHEFAVAGHEAPCLLRKNGTGNFSLAITNAEPVPTGGTATGNWPPKAKYTAVWGDGVVIANLVDVGPANAFGNTCGFLWWLSADSGNGGANVFSITDGDVAVPGGGTTYDYVADQHGDITGLAGGAHFGALFKPSATYRVEYYAGEWIVHVENVSERYGTRYHNSIVVADDEIYYMSDDGPCVLRRSGPPQLLGEGQILRALFDDTWVAGTNYTFSTTVLPYLVYGIYHPVQDLVAWLYRSTADEMEYALNYHRATGRWSICSRSNVYSVAGGTETGRLLAAGVRPRLATTRYSAAQGAVYIGNSGEVYEAVPTGTYRWLHKPTMLTPYLIHSRAEDDEPRLVRPRQILTYYELRAGATTAPQLSWTINQKTKLGTNTLTRTETVAVEGDDGRHQFSNMVDACWVQYKLVIGDATLANVSDLANIAGFEVMFTEGGIL